MSYEERMGGVLKQTNMKKVREVAKQLLRMEIIQDKEFSFIIHHPFFNSPFASCMFDMDTEETTANITTKKGQISAVKSMEVQIDMMSTYQAFFIMINKPYLPLFFKLTKDYLSSEDYSKFLANMWIMVEFSNSDKDIPPSDFVEIFRRANKKHLMEASEIKVLKELPDKVTIYRGVKPNSSTKALSWSLNKETAQWFANRFEENGTVYQAKIRKEDILAFFDGRKEQEVVVDFEKLYDIKKV